MKVGILTFHDGINYGAFLQVYALQSFLLRHGFQCHVINYKNVGFTLREYKCFLGPQMLLNQRAFLRNLTKVFRFKMAQRRLHLTNRIFTERGIAKLKFDAVVIGSDEVWNFGTDLIGYDPVYYSGGLKAGRLVSYAASFGATKSHDDVPEELRDLLNKIEYVSVRDENSANIMGVITKKPVQTVLDPTFLVDLGAEAITPRQRGFILVYGSFTEIMKRQVLDYARSLGKITVAVGYDVPWCDSSLATLGPFKWLGYFKNCDSVITTMYHGMIHAILNEKEFCMFSTPYRENKVGNFLTDLGLSDRFLIEDEPIESAFSQKIDYLKVNARIEARRRESERFLLGALRS